MSEIHPTDHKSIPARNFQHDILSGVKMHFFYVKSKILRMWLIILCNFYVTMFRPEHSLLRRSIPLLPPCPHPTLPATRPYPRSHPACHSTLPSTPPCLPATTPCQPSATTASWAWRRACAVLVVLLRLYVWGEVNLQPHPIFYTHHLISYIPYSNILLILSNILRTLSNILLTLSKILHTLSKILCTLSKIIRIPPYTQVGLQLYLANMFKAMNAFSWELQAQIEKTGTPNWFPKVLLAKNIELERLQSMDLHTLLASLCI